jgi:hypothetical protein
MELIRVIGTADHWAAGDMGEPHLASMLAIGRENLRPDVFYNRQMLQSRLQVLP